MQTIALIPGISRSGSTISAARFCGWNLAQAARFSFARGAYCFGRDSFGAVKGAKEATLPWNCYFAGFIASFGLGLLGVRFMFRIYEKGNVAPFAWYCLP